MKLPIDTRTEELLSLDLYEEARHALTSRLVLKCTYVSKQLSKDYEKKIECKVIEGNVNTDEAIVIVYVDDIEIGSIWYDSELNIKQSVIKTMYDVIDNLVEMIKYK